LVGVREADAFGPISKRDAADRILDFVVTELAKRDPRK
jgi:hypothetical protein